MLVKSKNRCYGFLVPLSLAAVLGFCQIRCLGQQSETITAIEKAWSARQQRIRSARVSWVEKHTVTKGEITDMARTMRHGARALQEMGIQPGSRVPPEDVSFDIAATFTVDDARARLDYDDRQWSASQKAYVPQPELTVYDGQLSKTLLAKGSPYTPWPSGHVTRANLLREQLVLLPLLMAICPTHPQLHPFDINTVVATGQRAILEGKPCIELQQRGGNVVGRLWVDPSRDFIVLRFLRTLNERTLNKVDVRYQQYANSEWLPHKWESISFRANGALDRSLRATVSTARLSTHTSIPPNLICAFL